MGKSSAVRFAGFLSLAAAWILVLLRGSAEMFPETYDELMLGGLLSKSVDIGLGGDYIGWGDDNASPAEPYDLAELADTIASLVRRRRQRANARGCVPSLSGAPRPDPPVPRCLAAWAQWSIYSAAVGTWNASLVDLQSSYQQLSWESLLGDDLGAQQAPLLGADFDPAFYLDLPSWLQDDR